MSWNHRYFMEGTKDCSIRTAGAEDINILTEVIRTAFRDVADCFGITPENCPRHPSNCTVEWARRDMDRGVVYCILNTENDAAGRVALERAGEEEWYLERPAVFPD